MKKRNVLLHFSLTPVDGRYIIVVVQENNYILVIAWWNHGRGLQAGKPRVIRKDKINEV